MCSKEYEFLDDLSPTAHMKFPIKDFVKVHGRLWLGREGIPVIQTPSVSY